MTDGLRFYWTAHPGDLRQAPGETRSSWRARIAAEYFRATIAPRLAAATPQLALP
jgi:hypothetical protein